MLGSTMLVCWCACSCICIRRPGVNTRGLLLSLAILYFEIVSLDEPGAHHLGKTCWPVGLQGEICPCPHLASAMHALPHLGLHIGLEIKLRITHSRGTCLTPKLSLQHSSNTHLPVSHELRKHFMVYSFTCLFRFCS